VIDLLPDRDAKTFTAWLESHPTVRIVTRDRSASYGAGTSEGAPDAVQIADRWHLANNLVDALEKTVAKQPGRLLGGATTCDALQVTPDELDELVESGEAQLTLQEDTQLAQAATRARRLGQYEQIVQLRQAKLSIADIAPQVGLSTKTVRRWLEHGSFPERQQRSVGATLLDSHHAYLWQRWREGCHNCAELHRELHQRGFAGSYATVHNYTRQFCQLTSTNDDHISAEAASPLQPANLSAPRGRYSPRQVAFMFIQQVNKLSETKAADLAVLLAERPALQTIYNLAQQFMTLLRQRDLPALNHWLNLVAEAGSGSLKRFAAGLRRDYPEVSAALLYTYSNGRTEGFVNKLKLLKRQMFGRAKLDLLRKRMIYLTQ
jgi:transposase